MRAAIICPAYPPSEEEGGVSHFTQILARHLAGLGETVTVITDERYRGTGRDDAVDVVRLPDVWDGETWKAIAGLVRDRSVQLVNLQYTPSMYSAGFRRAWRRLARRSPSVISLHTLWGGPKVNVLLAMDLLSTRSTLIATNSEVVYLLDRYIPFLGGKTVHIPIGSNIEPKGACRDATDLTHRFELRPELPVVSYFGMCYPGKGMKTLLETACVLRGDHRVDFRLLLIGGGGSDDPIHRGEIERVVESLGLASVVRFTGNLPASEVSTLLASSDVVFLPFEAGVSDRRGSLMAALSHGKAVVTSAPRIPLGLFRNGGNMLWPVGGDAAGYAGTILQILRSQTLRKRLERGAGELAECYRWQDIAGRTRDWFEATVKAF